jgi:hypothetical protein
MLESECRSWRRLHHVTRTFETLAYSGRDIASVRRYNDEMAFRHMNQLDTGLRMANVVETCKVVLDPVMVTKMVTRE